jgi:hypothetical protein
MSNTDASSQIPRRDGSPTASPRRWPRLLLKIVGGVVGALTLTVLVVGFAVDFGGLVEKQLVAQGPKLQAKLGRNLRVGRVRLKLLPKIRLEIRDVAIEAQPGMTGLLAQPLLSVGSLRANVAVLPSLISFGRRIEVDNVEVTDLRLQVVRTADGKLSYEDILEKLGNQPESPPMTQAEIDRLAGFLLSQAALVDAAVYFYDLSTPYGAAAPIKIEGIQFGLRDARLFAPFSLTLDMAILAAQRNFHLALTVGPLPPDLQVSQPLSLLRKAELEILPFEIEPLLRFLPPSPGVGLSRAKLEAKLNLETPLESGQLKLSAVAAARGVVLEQDASAGSSLTQRRGQPLDVRVEAQVGAALVSGDVKVDKLELALNDMTVSSQADLRSLWTTPAVHMLKIASRGLLLEKLLAGLPPVAIPKGTDVRGPLEIRGSASGSPTAAQIDVAFDLTPATVMLPVLAKPAGTPLALEFKGQVQGADRGLLIERLGLTLGPMALLLRGQVRSGDDLDLKVDTGTVDLDRLLRLLPSVERSVPKGSRIDGDLRVTGSVKKQREQLDVHAQVAMKNALIDQGELDLRGGATLQAELRSTPTSASVNADLDLTPAQLKMPDAIDKDRGVPMRLRAQIERSGRVVNVRLAELTLPGGTVRVNGKADLGNNNLDVKVPLVDLDLSKLANVLPALNRGSLGGLMDSKLRIALSVDGNPNKLASVRSRLDEFTMSVAGGTIKGTGEIVGLNQPRKIAFNFNADRLDLDRILGDKKSDGDSDGESKSGSGSAAQTPRWIKQLDLNGRLQIDSGRYKGAAVRDFLLEVTMVDGKLVLKSLRGQALGGNVSASGSTIDFGPSRPKFNLRAKLDRIDIGDVLALRGGETAKKISGRGSMDLSADGSGLSWADIAPRITGLLGLGLTDGHFVGAGLSPQIVNPLLNQMNKQFGQTGGNRDMTIRNLQAQFRIEGGKLHTNAPLRINTDEGALSLTGNIGLDKSINLAGTLELSPKTIAAATGGKVVPDNAIPVGLRLGGSMTSPQLQLTDIARTVAALLAAAARGRGAELLKGRAGALAPALGGAGGATPQLPMNLPALGQPQPGAQPTPQPSPTRIQEGLRGLFGR